MSLQLLQNDFFPHLKVSLAKILINPNSNPATTILASNANAVTCSAHGIVCTNGSTNQMGSLSTGWAINPVKSIRSLGSNRKRWRKSPTRSRDNPRGSCEGTSSSLSPPKRLMSSPLKGTSPASAVRRVTPRLQRSILLESGSTWAVEAGVSERRTSGAMKVGESLTETSSSKKSLVRPRSAIL